MSMVMQASLTRLQNLPLITLAAMAGKAIGGAAELATACDYRLMTSNCEIGYVQSRLAITAAWGGGSRLVKLVGASKALEMMTTGKQLTARQALDCGWVDDIVDGYEGDDQLIAKAFQWLKPRIDHLDCSDIRTFKELMNSSR